VTDSINYGSALAFVADEFHCKSEALLGIDCIGADIEDCDCLISFYGPAHFFCDLAAYYYLNFIEMSMNHYII